MLARDVILKFADRTVVPIEIDEVVEALREGDIPDEIFFFEADINDDLLRGRIEHWEYPDGSGGLKRCVDITIARSLSDDWKRLVTCKELLHILDPEECRVSNSEEIIRLEELVVLPHGLQHADDDEKSLNDKMADLYAASVLFPMAGRELLHATLKDGKISVPEIARIVDIPPLYAYIMMNRRWPGIYRKLVVAT